MQVNKDMKTKKVKINYKESLGSSSKIKAIYFFQHLPNETIAELKKFLELK